ncbi:SprA-related family protein [Sulfurivirga caldicuralii]|uniref:SprA-related family protein n=1 Tax=Sulfurivirga caldicuralii TaxID=364032 RepID=A0A1N6DP73_9GAMM|nr:putative metalloprotease CJM1_0395 family protein [Sulfurivirga caldicuralii]SIN72585.1 SprA-related family protein [Sulfurivirga caldicuralii]
MMLLPLAHSSHAAVLPSEPARPVKTVVRPDDTASPRSGAPQSAHKSSLSVRPAANASADNTAAQQAQVEAVVAQLKARDREVRAHEMAHLAAAGSYATSGARYTYQTGPDGRRYAIGGEVGIDVSPEPDPEKTLAKMQVVQQAALAPANPSAQDLRIAAAAAQAMAQAQMELARMRSEGYDANPGREGSESDKRSASPAQAGAKERNDSNRSPLVEAGVTAQKAWAQRLAIQNVS